MKSFADNIVSFNSYYFFTRIRPWRVPGDPMDLFILPVREGGRVAFQLVEFRRLVRHDPFAIFAVFLFWICVAFATATSSVATASFAVAMAVTPPHGTKAAKNLVIWAVCVAL